MRKVKLISAILIMIALITGAVFSLIYLTKGERQAKVVVTTFPIYDICREIMGSDDEIAMLENTGSDMHSYTPTANDIATLSKSELFIYIGGESDNSWVSGVVRSANNVNLKTLALLEIEDLNRLEENDENILEDHDHEHEHEHDHEGEDVVYDEHIWLSIKNMIIMSNSIKEKLITVFPEKQELIKINANEYIEKLISLDTEYENTIKNNENTIIIADRFPFRYLVHDYNIKYYAIFAGCSTESQASAETIAHLKEKIVDLDVNYLLILENGNRKVAESCLSCKEGLKILEINSCQSISMSTMQTSSYIEIMTKNLDVLKKALDV